MKERLLNFIIIGVILITVGCSSSKPPKELSNIEALKSQAAVKISATRYDTLKQTARSLAAQASLSWRSYKLNTMLQLQKRNLDNIFNFNQLILSDNVLPPVLVEGRNALNLADDFTIRVSDHDYRIIQLPRFVTAPPNWRNYIWMPYKKPETPNSTLLPQTPAERKIWNQYIQIGWNEGVNQADEIFSANLARLHRDFEGMILYRKLLAQNMVTPPYVSQADLGVTGDGTNLHINDRVLRITAVPELQPNSKNWKPVMSTKASPKNNSYGTSSLSGKIEKINCRKSTIK
ncbi:MAG: type IV secretion system DotC family protein [Gammaproteobacteria bacterium]|nr:type IV secretion system DotC family protein [Gammaproteobacteria bacterium]